MMDDGGTRKNLQSIGNPHSSRLLRRNGECGRMAHD